MDRPPDVPPRPEALAGPLVMDRVEVMVGVGVGPLGREEVVRDEDRRG